MFPRAALIVLGVLLLLIGVVVIIGHMEASALQHDVVCERGIARPYKQLISYMRQLAEEGRLDELRTVLIQAEKRSADISHACKQHHESIYASQVHDLTKSNQTMQPTAGQPDDSP